MEIVIWDYYIYGQMFKYELNIYYVFCSVLGIDMEHIPYKLGKEKPSFETLQFGWMGDKKIDKITFKM